MAFEELSGPKFSNNPRRVFASFDRASERPGQTTYQPHSSSLLKDTPPSIVVALTQLQPVIRVLDTVLAWITWTSEDHWSSFLLLASWWLVCLYGHAVLYYGGNWAILLALGVGYVRKKTLARRVARAVQHGAEPDAVLRSSKGRQKDTQELLDNTLYELDCFRARCSLVSSSIEPMVQLLTWEDPRQSAIIGVRLAIVSPLYVLMLWTLTTRTVVLILGTFALTFTSPWFKVICTVGWRLKVVRTIVSALTGANYLPGESRFMEAVMQSPAAAAFSAADVPDAVVHHTPQGSRFTTTISIVENQRRWLGLGWTPSLLPHERAPWTDNDSQVSPDPEAYGLPEPRTIVEDGETRTISWRWVDDAWRVERDDGRDADGWIFTDNAWRYPSAKEEYGKYTRRRKWIRNAECSEIVLDDAGQEVGAMTVRQLLSPERRRKQRTASASSTGSAAAAGVSLNPDKVPFMASMEPTVEELEDLDWHSGAPDKQGGEKSGHRDNRPRSASAASAARVGSGGQASVPEIVIGHHNGNGNGNNGNGARSRDSSPRKAWREVNGGKELVYVEDEQSSRRQGLSNRLFAKAASNADSVD